MKKTIQVFCVILLLFNGFGAFYGGIQLISDPSGSKLQLPLTFLEHSPFSNYLVPGIVLISVNGIFSFVTLSALFLKKVYAHWLVIAQGTLLSGWILVQMILIRMFFPPLHVTFLIFGIGLIACGFYQRTIEINTIIEK